MSIKLAQTGTVKYYDISVEVIYDVPAPVLTVSGAQSSSRTIFIP